MNIEMQRVAAIHDAAKIFKDAGCGPLDRIQRIKGAAQNFEGGIPMLTVKRFVALGVHCTTCHELTTQAPATPRLPRLVQPERLFAALHQVTRRVHLGS
jgi:hypothetical protein